MISEALANACGDLVNRTLLYPSSGTDYVVPVETFFQFIDEFWFVDKDYSLDSQLIVLNDFPLLNTSKSTLSGETMHSGETFEVEIRRDVHGHTDSNRQFVVNKCRGLGYNLFRAAFRVPNRKLSVLFYRGDSPGEGGSAFYWLRRPTLKYVVDQLEDNAIIVSDGSNAIRRFRREMLNPGIDPEEKYNDLSFSLYDRTTSCVGYLGRKNGPTLAWKLNRGITN